MEVLLILLGAGTLLIRVGMVLYVAGASRSKNAASAMFRGILDFAVAILAFWGVGAAIMLSSNNPYLAIRPSLLMGKPEQLNHLGFFYLAMFSIAGGFTVGVIGER